MDDRKGPLTGYRVLDLSDENGQLAGRMLADLGADTLVVEPIGGSPARRLGPFYHNIRQPEKSLFWFALNTNKRGITLNTETGRGQAILKQLVKKADLLIESHPPGHMAEIGLGYDVLSEINSGLVMASITPYGQTGPWRDFKGSDLVEMALGGLVYLSGAPVRPPLRVPVPQACLHSGSWAAAASMIALYGREATGQGDHVDVSMLEAATWASYNAAEWWSYCGMNLKREGTWRQQGLSRMRLLFECRDGYVLLFLLGGTMATSGEWKLVEWMAAENKCPDWLRGFDWSKLDVGAVEQKFFDDLSDAVAPFLRDKGKADLFDWAQRNELFLAPVSDTPDVLANPQLKSRDFWVRLRHPELDDTFIYPGPFAKLSETPAAVRRRAPLIGEHNHDVYAGELGYSELELSSLRRAGVI